MGATRRDRRSIEADAALETRRARVVSFAVRTQDGWGTGVAAFEGGTGDAVDATFAFTGKLLDGRAGDTVELRGKVVAHPRYGEQFAVQSVVVVRPESIDGVVAWLAATFPNVGAARAKALIAHCGSPAALWSTIETNHESLAEVSGITAATALAIRDTYAMQLQSRDHMIALRTWGLTTNQIQKCLDEWQSLDTVVNEIRANPYALAKHVDGFGFKRADEVARAQGIAPNDLRRVAAGIAYVVEESSKEGHTYLWGGQLQRLAAEILEVDPSDVVAGIRRAVDERTVIRHAKRYYLPALATAELAAVESIHALCPETKA